MPDLKTSIVIFGASGDLSQRKLIPALFTQFSKKRLPKNFEIVGFARTDWNHESYRKAMHEALQTYAADTFTEKLWEKFESHLHYIQGDLTVDKDFATLNQFLGDLEGSKAGNRLFYLSIAPRFFEVTVEALGKQDMARATPESGWRRLVIEKPFGTNLDSAQSLNSAVHSVFEEHQIYRIDHYLGKETAQNILFFRFANIMFEPVWNRNYIDHVQISVTESVDVGHRAGYYDHAGVLRDMFQNHLLQLLALTAMEPPASFEADAIRNEKVKTFMAVRPVSPEAALTDTVRAQYRTYRDAEGVNKESETPTFAALKLFIDNWRWQDVPFYLRSGKALKEKVSEIVIYFRSPPHIMFPIAEGEEIAPNVLHIRIQPDEGIHLRFEVKVPDTPANTRSVDMDFHYGKDFGKDALPDAYERLLLDAVNGDASLFTRSDGIEASWRIIDPIIEAWASKAAPPLHYYEEGSWGPHAAEELLASEGRKWLIEGENT